ncbi:MAG: hypothetical protein QOE92_1898, partial [Chloroflexota bacterium]|nr:hypothetical protein [Chloroflexota bacterium]
ALLLGAIVLVVAPAIRSRARRRRG